MFAGKIFHILIITALLFLAALFVSVNPTEAKTRQPTDYQLMKQTVEQHYGIKPIKFVDGNGSENRYWETILNRKNKYYIVVEKVVSRGNGTRHGWYRTRDGNKYVIGYNKKVPKGKQVISFLIWNPNTNYCDDVTYVIDNRKVRCIQEENQ